MAKSMSVPKLGKPTPIQVPAPTGMQIKKAKLKVKYTAKPKGMR